MSDDYKEWYNSTAKDVLTHEKQRRLKIVLEQMRLSVDKGIIPPSWENYSKSTAWKKISETLNKENQFMFRNLWKQVYRDTFPKAKV
jgi:hypothetical protein